MVPVKASDRFASGAVQATCFCCGTTYEVRDLSVGGCFLVGDSSPPPGNAMTLALKLGGHPPMSAKATVVWVNAKDKPRAPALPPGFGVRFTNIGLAERVAFIQYLRQLEERERVR